MMRQADVVMSLGAREVTARINEALDAATAFAIDRVDSEVT